MKIDLTVNPVGLADAILRTRERNILIPSLAQQKDPSLIPEQIKDELKSIGLWELNSRNLFRVTWKNEPLEHGGGFGPVNFIEIPKAITGVDARIIALVGKWFPTGSHKVGATFGCLVPRLVTGQFNPIRHKAVWPSTGNFCRGGAYNAALLGSDSIAILPEEMSRERFDWLKTMAGEVIATPGCESNVKEIFDKCWELRKDRDDIVIFNQFEEMGNHLWHYDVTGHAVEEAVRQVMAPGDRFAGYISQTGSAGTIGAGDYLKEAFPGGMIVAGEALQCPTLLNNGYGGHRIEGIGDKHVPWIQNVRNTDVVIATDDEACVSLVRLFNEPVGREFLLKQGAPREFVANLDLFGISGLGNLLCAIKFAKYFELTGQDIVTTVLTDSMELYRTRVDELHEARGQYKETDAAGDFQRYLMGQDIDHMLELGYYDKKRIHNLKYFTWVEQQGRDVAELDAQWYDPNYWTEIHQQVGQIDDLIEAFNQQVQS